MSTIPPPHIHFGVIRNKMLDVFTVFWRWCFNSTSKTWSIVGACMAGFQFTKLSTNDYFWRRRCFLMLYTPLLVLDFIGFLKKQYLIKTRNSISIIVFTKLIVVSFTKLQFVKKWPKCHLNLTRLSYTMVFARTHIDNLFVLSTNYD